MLALKVVRRRLHKGSVIVGLLAGAFVAGFVLNSGDIEAADPTLSIHVDDVRIDAEPVVILDSTGFGFGGPLHSRLSVYSNGLSTTSAAFGFGAQGDGEDLAFNRTANFKWVDPDRVRQLQRDLAAAGALMLGDNGFTGADIPLTTVTVFRGTRSNPFSFYVSAGQYGEVMTIINEFRLETFPTG